MKTASRLAQVLLLAGLGAIAAAQAEERLLKPMRAIAVVADSPDSIAGFCRPQIRENLINHGFRIVSPERAELVLYLYGNEDEEITAELRRVYMRLGQYNTHAKAGFVSEDPYDGDLEDVQEELQDLLEDQEIGETTYEFQLVNPHTGEQLAYGGKYEKSGSPVTICDDIADDIFDEVKTALRTQMVVHHEQPRSFQPVVRETPQEERVWEFYKPY